MGDILDEVCGEAVYDMSQIRVSLGERRWVEPGEEGRGGASV